MGKNLGWILDLWLCHTIGAAEANLRFICYQMLSDVIRGSSEGHQSASRGTPEALQRYSKVYQKTPVFLVKYCHNKDLKKIELRISVKNPKSESRSVGMPKLDLLRLLPSAYLNPKQIRMAEILMTKTKLLKWLTPLRRWGIESLCNGADNRI
jgi:hypothetical protein